MSAKRELTSRWNHEPWKTVSQQISQFWLTATWTKTITEPSEILAMLDGLPYREEVPGGGDLRGANLGGKFARFDFSGWDFSYSRCIVDFLQCHLGSARFDYATVVSTMGGNLSFASFRYAKLRKCLILESQALDCCFDNAIVTRSYFQETDLTGSSFRDADLTGSDFTGAILLGCDFRNAKLDDAAFTATKLDKSTDLRGASLINLYDGEDRDVHRRLIYPASDWRQATYDETTRFGKDPSLPQREIIDHAIAILRQYRKPEAVVLKERFKRMRSTLKKTYVKHWEAEFRDGLSLEERALFDEVLQEAQRQM